MDRRICEAIRNRNHLAFNYNGFSREDRASCPRDILARQGSRTRLPIRRTKLKWRIGVALV